MKHIYNRITALLLFIIILCTLMTPALAAPSNNYKLTGNEADDIVAVAVAQEGTEREDFSGYGFAKSWCGNFISWCARQADVSCVPTNITGGYSAINNVVSKGLGEFYCFSDSKTNTTGTSIYNYLKTNSTWGLSETALNHVHEVSRNSFMPQKGDIIIFLWSYDYDHPQFSHVGLVRSDYDGRGTVYTVEGNTTGGIVKLQSRQYDDKQIVGFVRPDYDGKSPDSTTSKIEYFDCNIQINCVNGKVINLYNNPGDGSRVDYFSKGQSMTSHYAARLSDSSTWYCIAVKSNGSVKNVWLKYDSSKMTLKDLSNSTPQTKPIINFNTSSLTLDLSKSSRQTVTMTITGDIPEGYGLYPQMSNTNVASVDWGGDSVGRTSYPVIEGRSDGTTTLTCSITNSAGNTLAKTSLRITVTAPSDPEYFNCNIEIDCDNGKTINLYSNPGDSSRVDYFSRGQSVTSQYGAKLDDGSTWYQVTVSSSGVKKTLWLKYDSGKMTVKEIQDAPMIYTVKYDANGGSGAPSNQTKTEGETLTLSSREPTRNGYTFKGWATSSVGSVQYNPGGRYTSDRDVTLYAVWSKNASQPQYFDCNVQISCISGKTVNLYNNPGDDSREDYFSRGQSVTSQYGARLDDGSTWYRVTVNSSGTAKTLWLKYESDKMTIGDIQDTPVTYTIKYNANGGSGAPSSQTKTEGEALTLASKEPVRSGYTFKGWSTSSSGSVQYNPGGRYTSDRDVTLYAVWSKNASQSQYFDCNVQISCISGKTVNLYNNPGDNSREDYFSKGQSVTSQYGARLDDGSTWYRVDVSSSGTVKALWLKYESDKMTVKDLSNSASQTESVTIKFNTTSITLDMSQKRSQKVTLTVGGNPPEGCTIGGSMSNTDIVAFDWGGYENGMVLTPTLTATAPGTTTLTCYVADASGKKLAETSLKITVTGRSTPEYFNCNVQISCINGKTVNLYNNPGDSDREDYFSKGQSVISRFGARLSDGSTWYRVTVNSAGVIKDLWLKYERDKMTVTEA